MHPNMKAFSKATAKIPNIRDMFALTPHFLNRLLNKLQKQKEHTSETTFKMLKHLSSRAYACAHYRDFSLFTFTTFTDFAVKHSKTTSNALLSDIF